MAEVSKFWNNPLMGDGLQIPYSESTDVATVLNAIAGCFDKTTNFGGVFQSQLSGLAVPFVASSPVVVQAGRALVYGTWYENSVNFSVTVPSPASATRIDRLVLRKDWALQTVRITRIPGVEGGGIPALVQTLGSQWDIPLAHFTIATNGTLSSFVDDREYVPTSLIITYPIQGNQGGTGLSNPTAYEVVIGGTTNGGNLQQVSGVGTSGQVLTSGGAGVAPSWSNPAATVPSGAISMFAAITTPPSGWLFCDGAAVSRTTYSALFSAISTTYGSGDGSTTFNVPDLRGRFAMGADNFNSAAGAANRITSSAAIANTSGEDTHLLSSTETGVASHSHTITDPTHSHSNTLSDPTHTHNQKFENGGSGGSDEQYLGGTGTGGVASSGIQAASTGITINNVTASSGITGTNAASTASAVTAHNNRPLNQVVTFIIKT